MSAIEDKRKFCGYMTGHKCRWLCEKHKAELDAPSVPPPAAKRRRYTLDLSEDTVSRIEQLREAYGFREPAEVLQHALRVLSAIERYRSEGYELSLTIDKAVD